MKSVILFDFGFLKKKYKSYSKASLDIHAFNTISKKIQDKHLKGSELLRIYVYDCPPFSGETQRPISKRNYKFSSHQMYQPSIELHQALKRTDYVSLREGRLHFSGWVARSNVLREGRMPASDEDYVPEFRQKAVDMKIGLDIAWISYEHIADRIIVVTGDSDFVPALKLARRQGVQVCLLTLGHQASDELLDNTDILDTSALNEFVTYADVV